MLSSFLFNSCVIPSTALYLPSIFCRLYKTTTVCTQACLIHWCCSTTNCQHIVKASTCNESHFNLACYNTCNILQGVRPECLPQEKKTLNRNHNYVHQLSLCNWHTYTSLDNMQQLYPIVKELHNLGLLIAVGGASDSRDHCWCHSNHMFAKGSPPCNIDVHAVAEKVSAS